MGNRGYTLIDFTRPSSLGLERDRVVRFMEYVRVNFDRIVKGIPAGCEVDLFAGGHAHNPGLVPLLALWAPPALLYRVPEPFRMVDELPAWCARLAADEVDVIVAKMAAPTWDELVRVGVHPTRRMTDASRSHGPG